MANVDTPPNNNEANAMQKNPPIRQGLQAALQKNIDQMIQQNGYLGTVFVDLIQVQPHLFIPLGNPLAAVNEIPTNLRNNSQEADSESKNSVGSIYATPTQGRILTLASLEKSSRGPTLILLNGKKPFIPSTSVGLKKEF